VIVLRPYQLRALELLEAAIAVGRRAPLLVLPTGAGKTVVACELMRRAVERGERALFLAPRRELVTQASRALAAAGVGHGVILAGADVQGGLYASASYGFDLPELSCVVLARPTRSLMLYLQMLGRGLRPADDKADCLVLDHSGAVRSHGFAHDERLWTLEGEHALEERKKSRGEPGASGPLTCPECACVFAGARQCPECGYYFAPRGIEVRTLDGELVEIGVHLDKAGQDRLAFFAEMRGYAIERRYKPGWAAYQFKEHFGEWPPRSWSSTPAAQPSLETRRWIKSRTIAWLKARDNKRMGGVAS
jgi:hypothetical protein